MMTCKRSRPAWRRSRRRGDGGRGALRGHRAGRAEGLFGRVHAEFVPLVVHVLLPERDVVVAGRDGEDVAGDGPADAPDGVVEGVDELGFPDGVVGVERPDAHGLVLGARGDDRGGDAREGGPRDVAHPLGVDLAVVARALLDELERRRPRRRRRDRAVGSCASCSRGRGEGREPAVGDLGAPEGDAVVARARRESQRVDGVALALGADGAVGPPGDRVAARLGGEEAVRRPDVVGGRAVGGAVVDEHGDVAVGRGARQHERAVLDRRELDRVHRRRRRRRRRRIRPGLRRRRPVGGGPRPRRRSAARRRRRRRRTTQGALVLGAAQRARIGSGGGVRVGAREEGPIKIEGRHKNWTAESGRRRRREREDVAGRVRTTLDTGARCGVFLLPRQHKRHEGGSVRFTQRRVPGRHTRGAAAAVESRAEVVGAARRRRRRRPRRPSRSARPRRCWARRGPSRRRRACSARRRGATATRPSSSRPSRRRRRRPRRGASPRTAGAAARASRSWRPPRCR
mmetsp:Transcript_15301/g.61528  ORF Transcript_15301/g.61528 Transcript_15301/m.61528 type:complete len:514 (-) Transcript_15301:254-1795(-)